jgi:hypothetical protein
MDDMRLGPSSQEVIALVKRQICPACPSRRLEHIKDRVCDAVETMTLTSDEGNRQKMLDMIRNEIMPEYRRQKNGGET